MPAGSAARHGCGRPRAMAPSRSARASAKNANASCNPSGLRTSRTSRTPFFPQSRSRASLQRSTLQVHVHPLTLLDPRPDLRRRSPAARLPIRIHALLHARGTRRSVRSLKAGVQAIVAHRPVTAAVAGKLVQHSGHLCRHPVRRNLVRVGKVRSGQLLAAQDRRQRCVRRGRVVRRHLLRRRIRPLSRRRNRRGGKHEQNENSLHNLILRTSRPAEQRAKKKSPYGR